jgi:hypothetical protein
LGFVFTRTIKSTELPSDLIIALTTVRTLKGRGPANN